MTPKKTLLSFPRVKTKNGETAFNSHICWKKKYYHRNLFRLNSKNICILLQFDCLTWIITWLLSVLLVYFSCSIILLSLFFMLKWFKTDFFWMTQHRKGSPFFPHTFPSWDVVTEVKLSEERLLCAKDELPCENTAVLPTSLLSLTWFCDAIVWCDSESLHSENLMENTCG